MNLGSGAATRIGNFRAFSISRDVDAQRNSTDKNILRLVGKNKRVLELGCACGQMSRALGEQGCTVVGIEIHPDAARTAADVCERVIVGDLDCLDFSRELGADRFDVVLAADVLEHLKDPLSVLKAVRRFLLPDGHVVVSVPNVAHISIRLALLAGKFPYGETGLLDQTQLRFFTRESVEKIMEEADLAIGHFERVTRIPSDPSHFEVAYDPAVLPPALIEDMLRDPEATTYQFVLSGYPLPESGLVYIRDRIKHLAHETEAARNEAARLQIEMKQARFAIGESELAIARDEVIALQDQIRARNEDSAALASQVAATEAQIANLTVERDSLIVEVNRVQELSEAARNLALLEEELRRRDVRLEEQNSRINRLQGQVETLRTREKDLRDMLLDAHDQLLRRDEEIASTLASVLVKDPVAPALPAPDPPRTPAPEPPRTPAPAVEVGKYLQYQQVVLRIRELVRTRLPNGGKVLVVSKGDDDLLRIEPCRGAHFPQREDGRYAGYYPADGKAAVEHLEQLQKQGAQYFLIPQTALWWLDHYRELAAYLNQHCSRIINEQDICVAFDIAKSAQQAVMQVQVDSRSAAESRPFGVNISGNITSEKGMGEAVRGQARSLEAAGVPVVLNNVTDDDAGNRVNEFTTFSDDNPFAVNLIHVTADALPDFVQMHEKQYFEGRYNIGFWAWEASIFPKWWSDRFQFLDEIWVGSDFVLDAISPVSPIPVIKAPLTIPNRLSSCPYSRSHFGLNDDTFVFVFVFDYMSIFQRKNPMGLVQAFRKAFGATDDALLVLKCGHSEAHPFEARMLKQACEGANIKIIDDMFSREEVNSLMNVADCYVSLHRSEGFGLTIAEAMSLGKPVIATGYSGNMEFMTSANSYPVKFRVVDIDQPYGPYQEGQWADPDLDHAAELMRLVFKDRDAAKAVGKRGRADILRNLSPIATGTIMRNRLLQIAELGKISAPEIESNGDDRAEAKELYSHLVERIHQIVETNTPAAARVAVVSRGDDDLIIFDGREGWHFPQDSEGRYAGYHPANDSEAIQHLEALRSKGGEYFLLPQTSFWWLDHYTGLRSHLKHRYHSVWSDSDCIIYSLAERSNGVKRGDGVVSRVSEKIMKWLQR